MGIHQKITDRLAAIDRDFAWLARTTGIPYKRALRIAKHGTQKVSLEDASLIADALGIEIEALIPKKVAA